jgi:polyhydroxybutyrate depolymerase
VAGRSATAGRAGGGSLDDDGGTSNGPDSSLPPSDAGGAGAISAPIVCTAPALTSGDHNSMLQHGGQQRQYIVHVPSSYDGRKAVPLVLDFHGWTSKADREEGASGWREKADAVGFIAVYPIGLGDSWNGGALCCGTSQSSGVDDEGFALALVTKMKADACIDPKRVYVTGISNGGAMSHLLACRHADVFAAAAPVSMGNGTTPCNPSRPISVVMVRGVMDELVAYTGGIFPSAKADFDMWKSVNGCMGSPMTTHQFCETYTGCKAGVEVTLCTLPNGVHNVYQDKAELSVADVAWEAFERQPLP